MTHNTTTTVVFGADHAGFALKEHLKHVVGALGYDVHDVGTHSDDRANYPEFGIAAARLVAATPHACGVIICGSGIGISIAANKVPGIRAANCVSVEMAQLARAHNNANMVALGQRLVSFDLATFIVETFLRTPFEGGRHAERVQQIHTLGESHE
jgi:ribose 5-phosphate isomerase B